MRQLIVVLFLLLISLFAKADVLDSLKAELEDVDKNTEDHVRVLYNLSWESRMADFPQAIELINEAYKVSKDINFTYGEAKSLSHLAFYYFFMRNPDTSVVLQTQAVALFEELGEDNEVAKSLNKLGFVHYQTGNYEEALQSFESALPLCRDSLVLGNSVNNLGLIYRAIGDYPKAIEYYTHAGEIYKALGNDKTVSSAYINIGSVYFYMKEWEKSLEYQEKALALCIKTNDVLRKANAITNIANINKEQGGFDKAIERYREALQINRDLGKKKEEGINLSNLAIVYEIKEDYDSALALFKQSFEIFNGLSLNREIAGATNNIGNIYNKQGNTDSALQAYNEALQVCEQIDFPDLEKTICLNLSNIYTGLEDHETALTYHQRYSRIKDSLINVAKAEKIANTETKFRTKELDEQIKAQRDELLKKRQRIRNYAMGIGLVFLAAIWLAVALKIKSRYATKIEIEKDQTVKEKTSLQAQLRVLDQQVKSLQKRLEDKKEDLPKNLAKLSKREIEVLLLVGEGLTDKEMAEQLYVSINTIRTHTRRIYDKLVLKNRAEAVNFVNRYKLRED